MACLLLPWISQWTAYSFTSAFDSGALFANFQIRETRGIFLDPTIQAFAFQHRFVSCLLNSNCCSLATSSRSSIAQPHLFLLWILWYSCLTASPLYHRSFGNGSDSDVSRQLHMRGEILFSLACKSQFSWRPNKMHLRNHPDLRKPFHSVIDNALGHYAFTRTLYVSLVPLANTERTT